MLEFKFRAWHKKYNVMISWELLQASMNAKEILLPKTNARPSLAWPPLDEAYHVMKWGNPFANPDIILMQYSGLRDVTRLEIYEGDILKYPGYSPRPVEIGSFKKQGFDADGYGFFIRRPELSFEKMGITYPVGVLLEPHAGTNVLDGKIVGNIYKNRNMV